MALIRLVGLPVDVLARVCQARKMRKGLGCSPRINTIYPPALLEAWEG